MGVHIGITRPPAEEASLFGETERLTDEAGPGNPGEFTRRVDQHELVLPGPAEEVADRLEPPSTVGGLPSKERLDVPDTNCRPARSPSLVGEE